MNPTPGASVRARAPYQSILDRPKLKLPGGARVAVWTIVNVENWDPAAPMPRAVLPPPMGSRCCRTCPTGRGTSTACGWASGASWRRWNARAEGDVRARTARPARSTRGLRGGLRAGWEFMGHGFVQKPMHKVEDQRAAIATRSRRSPSFTGKPPRGWESPGLTETDETARPAGRGRHRIRRRLGARRPAGTDRRRATGRMMSVPYTVEINDVVMRPSSSSRRTRSCAAAATSSTGSTRRAPTTPRVMAISIHPYLTGVPHRIKYLETLYDYILGHEGVRHVDRRARSSTGISGRPSPPRPDEPAAHPRRLAPAGRSR